jgi:rfaE bifunctional protein nucleotidyltransferase chain/domain
MLSLARTLGGRLVVLLNDDDSVRRRKGAGRPVVPAAERAELLLALTCVDDVVVFGDDTPERALAALRPDVYAKGADYRLEDLPEAPLIASWGGETVILPYEAGRSTTELIARSSRSSVRRS